MVQLYIERENCKRKRREQETQILSRWFCNILLGFGWLESLRHRSTQREHG